MVEAVKNRPLIMQKLLIKVIDELSSALGTLARPWIIKRDARAQAQAEVESVRVKLDALEDIRIQLRDFRSGHSVLPSPAQNTPPTESSLPAELNNTKQAYIEAIRSSEGDLSKLIQIEREINLAQISALAYEEAFLDDDEACSDEPLDPDWFAKWRNYAQDVSKEEMQRLWARVLKGEAKAGNAFSIHTMDFLSRMSGFDAEIIEKMNNFVLDGDHIFAPDAAIQIGAKDENQDVIEKILAKNGLGLGKRMYLSDLGILTVGIGLKPSRPKRFDRVDDEGQLYATITSHDKTLIFWQKANGPDNISYRALPVSTIGREILQLASGAHNLEYLRAIAEHVRDECSAVAIGDVAVDESGMLFAENITPF
jgi:hypothetical protein